MTEHGRVSDVLRSSALLRRIDGAIAALWRSADDSRAMSSVGGFLSRWKAQPTGDRRFTVAIVLGSAAVTSALLTLVSDPPAGWMWLVPPVTAASIALLLGMQARSTRT